MGMFRSHERLIGKFAFLRPQVDAATRAEIAWQKGQYRQARASWDELHAGDDAASVARRLERQAAVLWVRGAYLRAYVLCRRSVRFALLSGDPDVLGAAFETQARVLVHAARTPDLRWFATNARRRKLAERIDDVTRGERFGAHLHERLQDVRALLTVDPEREHVGGRVAVETTHAAETFNQYESLSAMLDFRRGAMRARARAGIEPITGDWIETYRRAASALGKDVGVRSLLTLPGAASHYSLVEGVRLLTTAPATIWHRLRLVAWFLLAHNPRRRR